MNTKARAAEIAQAAAAILAESGADINQQVSLAPLAERLIARTACHASTARRAMARAIRRARGELTAPVWGGDQTRPASATIRTGSLLMISQVYPDGMADLGRGAAEIRRQGMSRIIAIAQPDGSEIRILVL